jgi:hypothetical protein
VEGSRSASYYLRGGGTDPRDPAEGRRRRARRPPEGEMPGTPSPDTISTGRRRIAIQGRGREAAGEFVARRAVCLNWACTDPRGVRHEATDGPVMTGLLGHNPVCDHRYPTRTCGRSNPAVRSSWDNVTSPQRGGRSSREGSRRLRASRRSGARVDGRANSGELPINVVRSSKPKALTGLNQKVSGQVQGIPFPLPSLSSHRRRGRA